MDNKKSDRYYAIKSINEITIIQQYIKERSYDDFMDDQKLNDAVMFRLIQLVENLKSISTEFKKQYPNIPWGDIIGFRNGIVHEYGKTDYNIVYETITQDLDNLKSALGI